MIRRGFWLLLGAVLGVTGYRRVSRLARAFAPASRASQPVARSGRRLELTGRRVLAGAARAGRSTAEGVAFVRDVREGMAEYLDRQGQETSAVPGSQRGRPVPDGPPPGAAPHGAPRRRAP
jgi:hypothetical protein